MKSGIYGQTEIPMAAYLADPCDEPSLSSGCAHTLIKHSPLHAYANHPRLGSRPSDDSNKSDTGSVAHDMLFGGDGKICVIDPADYRSKPTKDNPEGSVPIGWTNNAIRGARDEARTNGLTPILAPAYAGVKMMAATARSYLDTSELAGVLDGGADECQAEATMLYEQDGTWFRTRPDWMNSRMRVMLHYKTTEASANPEAFARGLLLSMGYDTALEFYRHVFEQLTMQMGWRHVILVQEQTAPHACALIELDPALTQIAYEKVQRAISIWRKCISTGKWPAYSGSVYQASPTAWQLAEAEMASSS